MKREEGGHSPGPPEGKGNDGAQDPGHQGAPQEGQNQGQEENEVLQHVQAARIQPTASRAASAFSAVSESGAPAFSGYPRPSYRSGPSDPNPSPRFRSSRDTSFLAPGAMSRTTATPSFTSSGPRTTTHRAPSVEAAENCFFTGWSLRA